MLLHILSLALLLPSGPPAVRLRSTTMQIFPAEEDNASVEAIAPPPQALQTRGEQMATLLSALVDKPEQSATLLEASTAFLLEPFRPGPQEPGSIFADDSSLDEKIELYRATLEARIGSAQKRETKEALSKLRDHVLLSAELVLGADDDPAGVE